MSYPILYQAGETNFNHLGLGILKDTISAVVSEDLNGKFELDLVYAYNNRLSKFLLSGNIIKVDAGNILKEQLFTIGQVSKTLDGKISVHAEHVSYIMQDLTLKPKTVVYQQDAQNALKQLLNAIKETDHGFTVASDVSTISSSTWSVPDFKTPRDVLAGVRGSILDNWGGEYKFDNRRISLLKQRGSYANTVIAYGRNLLDFEQETSILETYTSIYPVVVKTEKDVEVTHTLPELVVDSQYLDKYANRKTLLVDFSDKFDDKNPYSDDKMRVLANAYIKANKVGIPKVTMTIKTLDLAKMVTEDYKAGRVERLDLADTVKVYFDRLGITTEAKVVGVKWNVLKESYDEYVLGERKATFGTVIRGSIAEVKAVADSAKKDAITALVSADGKNTNYYGNSSDGAPPNPKKGDIWFVKDGDKTTIKTWNGTAWIDLVSSDWQKIFEDKLTEELDKSKKELDKALAEKDAALKGLDQKIAAEMTVIDKSIAQGKLDTAAAQRRADDAVAKANANVIDLQAAKIDINKALNDSASAINNIKLVDGKVNSVTSTIADIKLDMNGKADKTTVASQISQSSAQVKVDVQSWTNGRLTDYSTIQATSNSIALATADKATKSQVTILSDQITNTVSSAAQNNLVYNATLQSGSDGWTLQNGFVQSSARNLNGNYIINFSLSSNSSNTWYFARSKQVPIGIWKEYAYAAAFMRRTDIPNGGVFMFSIEGFDSNGARVEFKAVNIHSQLTDDKWTTLSDMYEFTNSNVKTVCFTLATNGYGHYIACQPIMVNSGTVGNFVPDGMDKSQITQLATDINLRVTKDSVVNQINISNEGILIAGSKVQITGQTYIENGVITSAKIQDLSASKLIAGRIDASIIVVDNINANRITVGTLSADRIAANSITATHISIASLSALSANLGTVTAGTINAATVNIININANSITTGTLNADRIGANSITADKIKATSLDLFNNDTYTNVSADGMRIQSKAQIVFDNWRDSSNTLRTTQGVYIGGIGGGTKHIAFTRSNGTTFMLRAEAGMDFGSNQNVFTDNLNIYDNLQLWESVRVHGNLIAEGYIAMGGNIQEASIQYDKPAGTMNFRVPGGRSGSYFWFNQRAISEGSFDSRSKLSLKNVKGRYEGNALREIVNTDIAEYSYKNDPKRRQLSPIIDDINEIKKYHLPDIINDGESVNLYAMGSLSWLAIKQLAKKLENIEEKLDAIA